MIDDAYKTLQSDKLPATRTLLLMRGKNQAKRA